MKTSLIDMFVRGVWAMDPSAAQAYYPLVTKILKGESDFQPDTAQDSINNSFPVAFDRSAQSMGTEVEGQSASVVAVIQIKGAIVKYDQFCGPTGMETISNYIRQAADDDSVAGIILDFDTGGGQGDACMMPTAEIKRAREKKPVVAYVGNGMCASAGYWIASNCDEIHASFATDMIGSIGTFVTLADWSAYYESQGLPIHEVYATKSTEKNKMFKDALEGDYAKLLQDFIDPFNESFHATVREGRGEDLDEQVFQGGLFYADQALSFGLIDGVMSFEDVIQRTFELADAKKENDNSTSKMGLFSTTPKFEALVALAQTESGERTEEMVDNVNAELQSAGIDGSLVDNDTLKVLKASESATKEATDSLTAIDAALGEHKTEDVSTEAAITALVAANAALTQENSDLEAKVVEYGGKPAAETTSAPTENKKEIEEEPSAGQKVLDREAQYATEKLNNLLG